MNPSASFRRTCVKVKTNAHPLVEMTVMSQPKTKRTLVHLINLSGHSETAYFPPVEMRDIEVQVKGDFRKARLAGPDLDLAVTSSAGYGRFVVPRLLSYEVVVLE